ncbi:MAG TPA: DAK2 domain-containing protein [Solirubrobacteraceae bacterium]|jgi:dihydroxyacetone kinase|nr:DAK2 domain-containing protein [Solirubrobacteraceae bacterium]
MSAGAASTISLPELRDALRSASERMLAARDELCALDAVAGDGDLGATLATGFTHAIEALDGPEGSGDASALLTQIGAAMARKAPSTIGALLATAFIRGGQALDHASDLGPAQLAGMLAAGSAGVAERGRVTTGQRTVVDAMEPAAKAATAAAERGEGVPVVLRDAAIAARAGAVATAEMEPQVGRAGWIADRARGSADAGAAAWATFLEALADAVDGAV